MLNSVSGSTGTIFKASEGVETAAINPIRSQLIDALDLACPNFELSALGTSRQIGIGMQVLNRAVQSQLNICQADLGETAQRLADDIKLFIQGGLPSQSQHEDLFVRAAELNRADIQQTPVSRMESILGAALESLGSAREPLLNLLNITARTGLIVAATTVLRQVASYYIEQAIQEGDSPQASQAWAVAAVTMIGPAMSLMGAIRDECAGTANLQTRLGRVCMASITMGALIAAHLTGASSSMLTSAIATNVYTVARDVTNAFFSLQSNAGDATTSATAVTTVSYGAVQFLLAEVGALMPPSGAGRFSADLGYSLGADVIQGGLNAAGAVIDDFIFILCRSWPLLSPTAGLDSALSDPESLQRSVLEVRAGARLPSREQLADALLNVNASRTSAFQAINLVVAAVAVDLALSDYGETSQGHILNICLMGMLMLIYFPFIWTCSQRSDRSWSPEQLREQPTP